MVKRKEFWRNGRHFDNPEDLIGQVIGQLTVVAFLRKVERGVKNTYYYDCLCSCGNHIELTRWKLITHHTASCGCRKTRTGTDNPSWTGYQEISGQFWHGYEAGAIKRSLPFTVTIEEAWALYEKQDRRCALSGLCLNMKATWDNETRRYNNARTASLDRINSSKGYEPGNIQWVHKDLQRMKSDWAQGYFLDVCKSVALHRCGLKE